MESLEPREDANPVTFPNLDVAAGHADGEPLMESLEPREDDHMGKDREQEVQKIQSRADVGVVGNLVACIGVCLRLRNKDVEFVALQ